MITRSKSAARITVNKATDSVNELWILYQYQKHLLGLQKDKMMTPETEMDLYMLECRDLLHKEEYVIKLMNTAYKFSEVEELKQTGAAKDFFIERKLFWENENEKNKL